jgi:RecA-family ATPase
MALSLAATGEVGRDELGCCYLTACSFCHHFGFGVIVLDPLYKLNVDGEENRSRDMTILFIELDRLTTEAECNVVLNDHFSKGNQSEKDPLDANRESSARLCC